MKIISPLATVLTTNPQHDAEMTPLLAEIAPEGHSDLEALSCTHLSHNTNLPRQFDLEAHVNICHAMPPILHQGDVAALRLHMHQTHRDATEEPPLLEVICMTEMATEAVATRTVAAMTNLTLGRGGHGPTQ